MVDKFIFRANFVTLDMEEDKDVPFFVGWPILTTRRTLIDVVARELIIRGQH